MFREARYKKYANIVSFETIKKANKSVKKLEKEFNSSKTWYKCIRIERVVVFASNRALASSKRKNLKPETMEELIKISKIYKKFAKYISKELEQIKSE